MLSYVALHSAAPLVNVVIFNIRFDATRAAIEDVLGRLGHPPMQVYICRKGAYDLGKRKSCLATFGSIPAATSCIATIDGLEMPEIADVPISAEIARSSL